MFGGGSPRAGCAVGAVTVVALLVIGQVYGLAVGAVLRRAAAHRWAARGPDVL